MNKANTKRYPVKIETFADLQERLQKPVICRFRLDEDVLEISVLRVTPALQEKLRKLRRVVLPPWEPKHGPSGDYDPMNRKFLEEKDKVEIKCRALVVYTCCPMIAQQKPGLTDDEAIVQFIQNGGPGGTGILSENMLEYIGAAATVGGLNLDREVQRLANFTSTPDSAS